MNETQTSVFVYAFPYPISVTSNVEAANAASFQAACSRQIRSPQKTQHDVSPPRNPDQEELLRILFFPKRKHSSSLQCTSPGSQSSRLVATSPKAASSTTDEFGLMRNDDDACPCPDSPSKRQGLLGSLRSIKSLRTLRLGHHSPKKNEDGSVGTETPQTPVSETPSVSLNFEASPMDVPMFGRMTRGASAASSVQVHRSSPILVPVPSRESVPTAQVTPPGLGSFPSGTVPTTPAPLHKASVQEAIITNAMRASSGQAYTELDINTGPLLTPRPGSNLTLEDITAPDITITSPSVPYIQGCSPPGYFDTVPVAIHNEWERTKTLDTESGFSTLEEEHARFMAENEPEPDTEVISGFAVVPEIEPASFDQAFPISATDNFVTRRTASKTPSGSNDFGENVAYILYDMPATSDVGQNQKRCTNHWGRFTSECFENVPHEASDYDTKKGSSGPRHWTSCTELIDYTHCREAAAAEAKLMAYIEKLDAATLFGEADSYTDEKDALQEMIRAYARLRERTNDSSDGTSLMEGQDSIPQDLKDEVETSRRIMNRSLGG